MRALTVRQPWACAIVHLGKTVENRTATLGTYTGLVAIHAGKQFDVADYADDAIGEALKTIVLTGSHADVERIGGAFEPGIGAVIGVVDLVGRHGSRDKAIADPADQTTYTCCEPWGQPDQFHIELRNPRPLTSPIPARGALGLWRPDEQLIAAITEQLPDLLTHEGLNR